MKKHTEQHKKVGLALGSGGLRGLVHIGVIKALMKNDIPVHLVSGASVGSFVGAYFATFGEVFSLEKMLVEKRKDMAPLLFDFGLTSGLVSGKKISLFLEKTFHKSTFKETQIPLYIIATSLLDGKKILFHSGKITPAVQGSISVPVLFTPVRSKEKVLVDGGLSDPVPVAILKEKKADIVIAVNLYHKNEFKDISLSLAHVALRSVRIALHNLAKHSVADADIVINTDTSRYLRDKKMTELISVETIQSMIALGEREAQKHIPEIKKLLKK